MKIRLANNLDGIGGGIEIDPEEVGGKKGIERAASLSKNGIIIATEIFRNYPDIKQVTLDTMTDEERTMIEVVTKKGGSS